MKGSFPRCWKCGQEWQACQDSSFVPPEHRNQQQPYNQASGHPPPWNGATWQDSGSRSLRTRSRRKKQGKNKTGDNWHGGAQAYQKGFGKGFEAAVPSQGPMAPMPQMMPMMMPYPQQQIMAPAYQPLQMDKGGGKGQPPPPPLTMPSPPSTAMVGPPGQWAPTMQMMPIPAAPTGPVEASTDEVKKEGKAQANLNRLLKQMKKDEDSLTSDLQKMAHTMQKQDERDNTKELSVAVKILGQAKEDLLEAENAKAQLLSQWKTFLQQSVVKWREFSAQFQASESAHQNSIQAARLNVRKAQRRFDQASKREQAEPGDAIQVSDEEEDMDLQDDPGDGSSDQHDQGAQRIHDGMNMIVKSLVELSASADLLEQRVKRPRTDKEDNMGDGGAGGSGGASFH